MMGWTGIPARLEPRVAPPAIVLGVGLLASGWGIAHAVDIDGNGLDDEDEMRLAERFRPVLVLPDGESAAIRPVPVTALGGDTALTADHLWARVYNAAGRFVGVFRTTDSRWNPAPVFSSPGFPYAEFGWDRDALTYVGAPPGAAYSIYYVRLHPDFGGPDVDCPAEWEDLAEEATDHLPPTAYAHVFAEANAVVVQYWFFFVCNDWVNNHEGDWEHVHVRVSSADPEEAELEGACFYFHGYHRERAPPSLLVADEDHLTAWVGGSSDWTCWACDDGDCPGDRTDHPGSHAFYPAPGLWTDVGADVPGCGRPGENVGGRGRRIDWQDLEIVLLPEPASIDYAANPGLSWHAALLPFGTPFVPSYCDDGCDFWDDFPITGWLVDDCGNRAPPGPAHHASWGVFSGGSPDGAYPGAAPTPSAKTLRVPGDYATVGRAAAAVLSGDTILVGAGDHEGDVVLPGGIVVRSEAGAGETRWIAPPFGRAIRVREGGRSLVLGGDGAGFTFDRDESFFFPVEYVRLPGGGGTTVRGNHFAGLALFRALALPAGTGSVRIESNRFGAQTHSIDLDLAPGRSVTIGGSRDEANDFFWLAPSAAIHVDADSCGPCEPVSAEFNYWGTVGADSVVEALSGDPGWIDFDPWTDSAHVAVYDATSIGGPREPRALTAGRSVEAAPSPTSAAIRLRVRLPAAETVRIVVVDARGRRATPSHAENVEAGEHVVSLGDAGLPSGTYFVIVEGSRWRTVRRVTVVR